MSKTMQCPKIIVDCDAGTDDAVALAMLIAAHKQKKVEILGITCVSGNTHVDNVINNVFRTLHVCDASHIPVYKGADSALLSVENVQVTADHAYHGSDGFGDVFMDKVDTSKLKEEHAVHALQRLTATYYREVTILCLAPLTNIALVIKMYPDFTNSVRKFLVMGGNYSALGNATSQAEFNFYADPESAHILLYKVKKNLWLFPWETCLKSQISLEWRNMVFGKIQTPIVEFINAIERGIAEEKAGSTYIPCDVFVAGVLLKPDIANDIVLHHVDIELRGVRTRGQVVVDHLMSNEPNAYIIQAIDIHVFKKLMLYTANPNSQNSRILLQE